MLEPGADRRALAAVRRGCLTIVTVLSPSWASTSRVPSALPSSTTMISRSMRQLDRAHAAHDLDHRVALVEDRHDHRELPVASAVRAVRHGCCHALAPPVPLVGAGETLAELDRRAPSRARSRASVMSGWRCVGSSIGQRLEHDLRRSTPVTSSTVLGQLEDRELVGVADVHRADVVGLEQTRGCPAHLVVDVAERTGLLAVAVDRERLALASPARGSSTRPGRRPAAAADRRC